MNFLVELILVAILLLFMYEKPRFLVDFANSTLGKVIMVIIVVMVAKTKGLVGGLLAALILVILLHSYKEGLVSTPDDKKTSQVKKGGIVARKKKSGDALKCTNDKDCGACQCRSKCNTTGNTPVCMMEYVESPYRRSSTNRVDQENTINRNAEEATLSASKQENDQTNN